MKRYWQLFLIIELSLFIALLWHLVSNPPLLVVLILSGLSLYFSNRLAHRSKGFWMHFFRLFGGITMGIIFMTNVLSWTILLIAVIFIVYGTRRMNFHVFESGHSFYGSPWEKKEFIHVKTSEPMPKSGRHERNPWFGNQKIGGDVFEWDDINMAVAMGDTIIDLGNTILPKDDNLICIRKGTGKTRILVPVGTGVMICHSAMYGTLRFSNDEYRLQNETVKLYSDDYDTQPRHLKIMTNVMLGDLEVLFV